MRPVLKRGGMREWDGNMWGVLVVDVFLLNRRQIFLLGCCWLDK